MRRIPLPAPSPRDRERSRGPATLWLAAALLVAAGSPSSARTAQAPGPASEVAPGRQIAVLPLLNRTGEPAPLAEIREELAVALADRGLSILDPEELERFMRRHRLRYTGGVHGETARALKAETGARAALVTSLDLYQESDPPKIGITSRLVSASDNPRILWMDSQAESGDQSPGLLGLGLVSEPAVVRQRVIARLADSLTRAAEGAARGRTDSGPRGVAKRFRPKIAYAAADGGFAESVRGRIAVLPLANESTTRYAGEILTDQLVHHLVRSGARVVEPGVVRHALLEARQIQPEGPSIPQVDVVRAALDADLILYGEVAHYQEAGAGTLEPVLGFSLRAISTSTRQVVWSSVSHTKGNDGVFFFDVGQIATAHHLSTELSRAIVVALAKTGQEGEAVAPPEQVGPPEEEAEELAILAGDAGTLTRLLDAARSARDGLAAELAAARHEAAQARAEAEKLERRLAAIDQTGSGSQVRFAELVSERDALLTKLSEADRRQRLLEDSIDSLEKALGEARGRPAEAEAALATSEAEKAALGERLAAAEAEEATFDERLAAAEAEKATLNERLAAAEMERSSLAERLAEAEIRTATLEGSLRSLEAALAETRQEAAAAQAESRAREADLLARLNRSGAAAGVAPAAAGTAERAPERSSVEGNLAGVEAAVRSWADAWAGQRTGDYLARYSKSFQPPGGLSRGAWERQRRERLSRPEFIEVTLESMHIEVVEPGLARASFRQTYRSDTYGDVVTKTLELAREEGGWTILRERVQ